MKRRRKKTIHDVSTYVIKDFRRPCRECAIVVIGTMLLIASSISTSFEKTELKRVDAFGEKNAAPAVLSISETTEEENDTDLNESSAVSKQPFETSGDFEALGTFEAYETLKLLKSVQTLTEESSDNERSEAHPAKDMIAKAQEQPEMAGEMLPEEEEQQEAVTVEAKPLQAESTSTPENDDFVPSDKGFDKNVMASAALAAPEEASETIEAPMETVSTEAASTEESSLEEISIAGMEAGAVDCGAAPVQTDICGLSASEYDALCRIVEAEAGTEGEEGKLLVANVVLNRVADPSFPSTIEGVIMADGQFSPVQNGRYQRAVATPETLAAVNRALNGENISKGALYFKSVHSTANWGNRTWLYNYRNHNFYQ